MQKTGRVADIIFRNEENFYTVAVFENDEEMEQFEAVGKMPSVEPGMSFELTGEWKTHPSFGEQFLFTNCTEILPSGSEAIREFLASGVIRGIGRKMAGVIVSRFGDETLDIIGNEPDRLCEVSGIGKKTAEKIASSFREHREFADVSVFFAGYGISTTAAMKMYKKYGGETVQAVKENPYRLISDLYGVGFRQVDEIAQKLGISFHSEYRISSGLKFALRQYVSSGSTYAPYDRICSDTASMLDVSIEEVEQAAQSLAFEGEVMIRQTAGGSGLFSDLYDRAETGIAGRLLTLRDASLRQVTGDVESRIQKVSAELPYPLSHEQQAAVRDTVEHGVCVITGGPGTGKTTIINALIGLYEPEGFELAIAAPTGRAAKRITETTGREAVTIHRLLEYTFSEDDESMHFGRDHSNVLEQNVIIVDEMSMVDVLLMDALTDAIAPGSRLVILGDVDQLPSVGAGRVLGDIIDSEVIHVIRLKEFHRQTEESMIAQNAHEINQGSYPVLNGSGTDFFMVRRNSEAMILSTLIELCCARLPRYYSDYDPIRDIQVLTPIRKGMLGMYNLNEKLQQMLNPPQPGLPEKKAGGRVFRRGDKVMQIRNNYQQEWRNIDGSSEGKGVFNGDVGFITDINHDAGTVTVLFDEIRSVDYTVSDLDELELAYAITIHKSQGSEFPVIVMPIASFPPVLSVRNLLYTGVTRGKQGVVLVGSEMALHRMIDNNTTSHRYTGLCSHLRQSTLME